MINISRTSAIPFLSLLVLSGCGAATTQQLPSSSTARPAASTTTALATSTTHAASTTASTITTPASSPAASERAHAQHSAISGRAVSSLCPILPAGEAACPRRPVQATITLLRLPGGHQLASVQTNRAGTFRLDVPPGSYELVARATNSLLFSRLVTVEVRAGRIEHLEIMFIHRHPLPVAAGAARCNACPLPRLSFPSTAASPSHRVARGMRLRGTRVAGSG